MDQRYCGLKLTKVSQLNNDPEQGAKEAFAGRASTVVLGQETWHLGHVMSL